MMQLQAPLFCKQCLKMYLLQPSHFEVIFIIALCGYFKTVLFFWGPASHLAVMAVLPILQSFTNIFCTEIGNLTFLGPAIFQKEIFITVELGIWTSPISKGENQDS